MIAIQKRTHILKAQEGVAAVEFALIAPVALLLIMGIIETSLVMFAQNVLESATFAAARTGKTGFVETDATREATIRSVLEDRGGVVFDTSLIDITSLTYARFDQIGDPEPYIDANNNQMRDDGENFTDVNGNGLYDTDMGADGVGNAGEIVVYTVSYPWNIFTPMVQDFLAEDGVITLSSRMVIQNEPF